MLKRILAGVAVAVTLAGAAVAGPLEDGIAAYERGDYATALMLWRPVAEQGDADAQLLLGIMHIEGAGVPQDFAEAANWFRRAAEQGYARAQYILGGVYESGTGVPQDFAKAAKWFRRAAEQGSMNAQARLSSMYLGGEGVPQDAVLAHMWINLAAAQVTRGVTRGAEIVLAYRDSIASLMTPDQIAEAQRLAREWKPTPER